MARLQPAAAVFILALLMSCESAEEEPLLSVSAPRSWLGATVQLDGQEVAELSEMMSNTGLLGAVFRKLHPESPLHDLVAINLPLASWNLEAGQHEVVVRAGDGTGKTVMFQYPFRDGATQCLVFVDDSDSVVGDDCAVEELDS